MAISIPFTSQSRNQFAKRPDPSKIREIALERYKNPTVIVQGDTLPLNFREVAGDVGVFVTGKVDDMSKYVHADAVVFYNMHSGIFGQNFHVMNFLVSYDIPIVWLHQYVDPGNWTSNFRLIFVGFVTPQIFWREVCQLIA